MSGNESMQACRVLRNPAANVTARVGTSTILARSRAGGSRTLANITASESQTLHEPELYASRKHVSVLLQKTASLLPQTLSTADSAVGPDSSLFWSNILERSITELSSGSEQVPLKATVAGKQFCGRAVYPFIQVVLALHSRWFRQVGIFA